MIKIEINIRLVVSKIYLWRKKPALNWSLNVFTGCLGTILLIVTVKYPYVFIGTSFGETTQSLGEVLGQDEGRLGAAATGFGLRGGGGIVLAAGYQKGGRQESKNQRAIFHNAFIYVIVYKYTQNLQKKAQG